MLHMVKGFLQFCPFYYPPGLISREAAANDLS